MRWYVSRNGETSGPAEEAQVREWAKGGSPADMVRDEVSSSWMRLDQSPFAQHLPLWKRRVGCGAVALILFALLLLLWAVGRIVELLL